LKITKLSLLQQWVWRRVRQAQTGGRGILQVVLKYVCRYMWSNIRTRSSLRTVTAAQCPTQTLVSYKMDMKMWSIHTAILRTRIFLRRKLVQSVYKQRCSSSSKIQTKLFKMKKVSKIADGYHRNVVDTEHTSK
jgi:hypothetical protein